MFFNMVRKGSQRNRKENGLFFASQVIAIIAFYIIWSLENQDVMIFLQKMESDAVDKLFQLIPVLYGFSIVILFFLAYFAGKYQMERRSHEFGMYLMMGMSRQRLFWMLAAEEIWNSVLSLAVGIPAAVFISEIISLVTAKLVGLGIIGHRFTFSMKAVLLTAAGYCLIHFVVLLLLSSQVVRKEIVELLSESQERKRRIPNRWLAAVCMLDGLILLAMAYGGAISGMAWGNVKWLAMAVAAGLAGTFLLFHGLGFLFELLLKAVSGKKGLAMFNFRQLQESVFMQPNILAVVSLLVMTALCCFGYGISVSLWWGGDSNHVLDYTFEGEEQQIRSVIEKAPFTEYIDDFFDVRETMLRTEVVGGPHRFSFENLLAAVGRQEDSREKEILLNNLGYVDTPFLISLSGYNRIRQIAGKELLELDENQAAVYSDPDFYNSDFLNVLNKALGENITMEIDGKNYSILPELYLDAIVTDRAITISFALIVSDEVFAKLSDGDYSSYWNATLKQELINEDGLMQAIMKVDEELDGSGLVYESYLKNMGRQLFYRVAGSYTTIYLAVIFLIISNTVLGVQFLMQQRKTGKRYQMLMHLGCTCSQLCRSARQQIAWYFTLPVAVAAVSSLFGIRSLLTGVSTAAMKNGIPAMMMIAGPVILALCVVEWIYMRVVMKMSDKNINAMTEMRRDDN